MGLSQRTKKYKKNTTKSGYKLNRKIDIVVLAVNGL